MHHFYGRILSYLLVIVVLVSSPQWVDANPEDHLSGDENRTSLRYAFPSRIFELLPLFTSLSGEGLVGAQLFASPLRLQPDGKVGPYLVESWSYSEDSLRLTLHLRQGAVFHDGQPITASDLAFSLAMVKKHHPFRLVLANLERVETPDSLTAVLVMSKPIPALLRFLIPPLVPILPRHVYGDGHPLRSHPAAIRVVGSGPFQLDEFVPGKRVVLKKFDRFFLAGRPHLEKITITMYPESEGVPLALERGDEEAAGYLIYFYKRFSLASQLKVTQAGYENWMAQSILVFNNSKPPLDQVKIRQALSLSFDRSFLDFLPGSDQWDGKGGVIPPGTAFYHAIPDPDPFNVAKANKLLDEAGYPRDENGKRFSLTFSLLPDETVTQPFAELLRQSYMRKVGIELDLIYHPDNSSWGRSILTGSFHMALNGTFLWGDPQIGVHRLLHSKSIYPGALWANYFRFIDPMTDALLDEAGSTMDQSVRMARYKALQRRVSSQYPALWLAPLEFSTVHHENLIGLSEQYSAGQPWDGLYWQQQEREAHPHSLPSFKD
ncbi:MAG: ABC transporter substrate-binding protein [Magnetococcales bacterium]|nr:ABC transporter substrate-binding protein [Magnetococcales bacterium]